MQVRPEVDSVTIRLSHVLNGFVFSGTPDESYDFDAPNPWDAIEISTEASDAGCELRLFWNDKLLPKVTVGLERSGLEALRDACDYMLKHTAATPD